MEGEGRGSGEGMMEGDLFTSQQLNEECFRRSLKRKTRYKPFPTKKKRYYPI